ncbi:hypothetical protein FBZ92_119104 [Nitrospirillum viridazoti]|uniref:Uncharacterized protein n=2 Tax=Nitrospirillum TaxID=1543705 RepID=A0A560I225_9PROT|nr:hypothetical protein FBZ92_119104 [Nitrospirillum amazonense]
MLDTLPPLKHLNKDGLRFVAMPSFGVSDYAVALWLPAPDASEAQGLFAAVEKSDTAGVHMGREFTIPATEYRTLMSNLDRLIQTGNRDNDLCLDGTGAAFDRFKDGTVISSLGNCSPMFEELKLVVLKAVRRFAPGDDLPTEDDWHRSY